MNRSIAWSLIVLAFGCGGAEAAPAEYPPVQGAAPTSEASEGTSSTGANGGSQGAEAPAKGKAASTAKIVAGKATTLLGPEPRMIVRMPPDGKLYKSGDVLVTLRLDDWEMQPEPGSHLHVIVDNEMPIDVRDLSKPLNINKLFKAAFGRELAEGTHVVRIYPAYTNHEAVRGEKVFGLLRVHVASRTSDFPFNKEDPLLTVGSPGSCQQGGKPVLIDFMLGNVSGLDAKGTRIRYTLDDSVRGEIVANVPHFIEDLAEGEHRLRLELVGADGKPVPGPYNDTTRVFKVAASCK